MAHRARMTEMEIVKSNLGITYSSLILFQHGGAGKYQYRAEGKKRQGSLKVRKEDTQNA